MLIDTPDGPLCVFIIGMIGGGYAYFGVRSDERRLWCGRPREFVSILLGRPPASGHGVAPLCSVQLDGNDDSAAEHLVLRKVLAPLASLRIDVQSSGD
jgi:hypothetical protein